MPTQFEQLKNVVKALQTIPDCRPVSVGGSVRDAIIATGTTLLDSHNLQQQLELTAKDFDLEVFGASSAHVYAVLQKAGIGLELVGRAFPVYKVKGYNIDISFPRRENKTGDGHTDFSIVIDAGMPFEEAALRRDFTCNAIGYDWNSGEIVDPYGGVNAIMYKVLDPVSPKFKEDALRVLRCFKFISRLGFKPTGLTMAYSWEIVEGLKNYAYERLVPEWIDFILHSRPGYIKYAMEFLNHSNLNRYIFTELSEIVGIPQHPDHHPEGTVDLHTIHCLEYFAKNVRDTLANNEEKLIVGLAVLCHDLGKATHTTNDERGIKSIGHEDSPRCREFLSRLFAPTDKRIDEIELLVKAHMRPMDLFKHKSGLPAIRRLNIAVNGRIDRLLKVVECDQGGRPPKPVNLEGIAWVLDKSKELNLDTKTVIKPIIQGRHLITHLNLKPSKIFTPILATMFEEQLDGVFNNEEEGIKRLIACYRVE